MVGVSSFFYSEKTQISGDGSNFALRLPVRKLERLSCNYGERSLLGDGLSCFDKSTLGGPKRSRIVSLDR